MNDKKTERPGDKLYIYAGKKGGRFLFDRKLNVNEEEYNHFAYMGTFNEVVSKFPSSIRSLAEKQARTRGADG